MADLWQRIKNWIIKKLGGYTKKEYDFRPIERFEFLPQPETRGIITLRTEATLDTFMSVPHEWVEGRMLDELAKQMKPFVVWEFNDDYMDFRKKVRASIKVVDSFVAGKRNCMCRNTFPAVTITRQDVGINLAQDD